MLPLPRPEVAGAGHVPDPLLAGAADRPGRLQMPHFILLFAGGLRGFHHRPQFKHVGLKIRAREGRRPSPCTY